MEPFNLFYNFYKQQTGGNMKTTTITIFFTIVLLVISINFGYCDPEFLVNNYTESYQGTPVIAMDAEGNFVDNREFGMRAMWRETRCYERSGRKLIMCRMLRFDDCAIAICVQAMITQDAGSAYPVPPAFLAPKLFKS